MEKFLGKFKAITERTTTEEFNAYFEAMKFPDEAREMMRKNMPKMVTCLFKEEGSDDTFREFNDFGDWTEQFVFKLGVPATAVILGMDTTNTFTLSEDGSRLLGVTDAGGQITTSSRYWEGDVVVFESSGNGATLKTYLKRVDSEEGGKKQ